MCEACPINIYHTLRIHVIIPLNVIYHTEYGHKLRDKKYKNISYISDQAITC